jgi:alpha-tubulin suppressor-like RCC1 family protein
VDGALVASGTGLTATLNTSAQMRFGSLASGVNYFRGQLDEVKIWSTARSQVEIQAGMHQSPDLTDANLAGYWPFREGPLSVQTADVSGRGRPGRLVNRPMWALSPAGWTPSVQLNGANRVTNECHTAFVFVDPGAALFASPAALSAANLFNLALKANGAVVAWGYDSDGQTNVPPTATNVVALAAGAGHSLALKGNGTVVGWGANIGGATIAPPTATNVVAIAAGTHHSLALKADGTVVAWGDNYFGSTNVPVQATNIVALAAFGDLSLTLRADGGIVAWGHDNYGQTNVPPAATNVVALAAGNWHSLALKADGTVVGWGRTNEGQTTVPSSATNVVAIAAGGVHSLALKANGTVVA